MTLKSPFGELSLSVYFLYFKLTIVTKELKVKAVELKRALSLRQMNFHVPGNRHGVYMTAPRSGNHRI